MELAIIGNFGSSRGRAKDGQTVKTCIVSSELEKQLGKENILKTNTTGGFKNLFKAPFQCISALFRSKNVAIFPAHNGVRVYAPILALLRYLIPNRRLHYVVIGGWLPEFVKKRRFLAWSLKRFYGIYVETSTMKRALEEQGFTNIYVMPNCKYLDIIKPEELSFNYMEPYKLCTFSRVMKEKGIGDAVEVVKAINEKVGKVVYELDIYGSIDANQTDWFAELQKGFPEYIHYKGCVDFDKSVETLKEYFALLFPTRFYTEGIPGTIIDAYAAGVPVISARWESYSDVVSEKETGVGFGFGDENHLKKVLEDIAKNPKLLIVLKPNCIEFAKNYLPQTVVQTLTKNFI